MTTTPGIPPIPPLAPPPGRASEQPRTDDATSADRTTPQPQQLPPGAQPGPGPGGATATGFWDQLLGLGVRRDRRTGWVGGVAAGLANRWGIDPLLIRALFIALTIIGGFGVVAYLMAWLLLPDTDGRILLRAAAHGDGTGIALIVLLAIVATTGLAVGDSGWGGGWLVPLAVLVLILTLRSSRRGSAGPERQPWAPVTPPVPPPPAGSAPGTVEPFSGHDPTPVHTPTAPPTAPVAAYASPTTWPPADGDSGTDTTGAVPPHRVPPVPASAAPPPPPRPQRRRAPRGTGVVVLGAAVVAFGLGHLLDVPLGFPGAANLLGVLLALTVTSVAALALGAWGRRGGAASVLALLLLVPLAGGVAAERIDLQRGEAVSWTPTTPTEVRQVGAGTLSVDLGQLPVPAAGEPSPSIAARLGTGDLTVLVPEGTELTIHAAVGIGEFTMGPFTPTSSSGGAVGIQIEGDANGVGINRTVTVARPSTTGAALRTVHLDANVGVGSIRLQEK